MRPLSFGFDEYLLEKDENGSGTTFLKRSKNDGEREKRESESALQDELEREREREAFMKNDLTPHTVAFLNLYLLLVFISGQYLSSLFSLLLPGLFVWGCASLVERFSRSQLEVEEATRRKKALKEVKSEAESIRERARERVIVINKEMESCQVLAPRLHDTVTRTALVRLVDVYFSTVSRRVEDSENMIEEGDEDKEEEEGEQERGMGRRHKEEERKGEREVEEKRRNIKMAGKISPSLILSNLTETDWRYISQKVRSAHKLCLHYEQSSKLDVADMELLVSMSMKLTTQDGSMGRGTPTGLLPSLDKVVEAITALLKDCRKVKELEAKDQTILLS